jgi:hypothetical protein
MSGTAFAAASIYAHQRAPRRVLTGGPKGRGAARMTFKRAGNGQNRRKIFDSVLGTSREPLDVRGTYLGGPSERWRSGVGRRVRISFAPAVSPLRTKGAYEDVLYQRQGWQIYRVHGSIAARLPSDNCRGSIMSVSILVVDEPYVADFRASRRVAARRSYSFGFARAFEELTNIRREIDDIKSQASPSGSRGLTQCG